MLPQSASTTLESGAPALRMAARIRWSISAFAVDDAVISPAISASLLPPVAKRLLRHLLEVAHLRPSAEHSRQPAYPTHALTILPHQRRLCHAPKPLRSAEP